MNGFPEFDPGRELSTGATVLEASAGTGKTHRIADLAARLIGEGRATIERLLMVTFGRDATRELRSRVRTHLIDAAAQASDEQVRGRLTTAVGNFDAAAVMTIHEFCQAMYSRLGVLAAGDPSGTMLPDLRPLAREVAVDEYLKRYAFDQRRPPMPLTDTHRWNERDGAATLAQDALDHALREVVPEHDDGIPAERVGFASSTRAEAARRRRRLGLLTFDDQLARLRDALADPITGRDACARLLAGVDFVLVDEFQDTDPVQWEILQRLFGVQRPVVLIGDPKQAIYTFRGADVQAYLKAAQSATQRYGLSTNYRSDAPLVDALGALFGGLRLGDGIDVHPVTSHRHGAGLRRAGSPVAPVLLTTLDDEQRTWSAEQAVIADVVRRVRLLLEGHQLVDNGEWREVDPGDIAILVRRNKMGHHIADALRGAGVTVALSGAESIFDSPAAGDWLTLLRALASDWSGELRKALRTLFFDASLADLAVADERQLADWTATLRQWGRILSRSGVAALFAAIGAETDFVDRVLARPDGERQMTDFRHVAELLHEASGHERPTAGWLAEWLAEQLAKPSGEGERTRRLETDSRAVQVKTVHRAKGLQYPIVLLPDLWQSVGGSSYGDNGGALLLHDDQGRALVDLGGVGGAGRAERLARARAEADEEELRLLYVAFTRARSHVVAWWARTVETAGTPLHRVLYRDRRSGPSAPERLYPLDVPPGSLAPAQLDWLAAAPGIQVQPLQVSTRLPAPPASEATGGLRALQFDRTVDTDWRRTSYSGLTAGVHHDAPLLLDEPEEPEGVTPSATASAPSPMADLPGGTQFGSLVHALFEQVDPGDGPAELRANLARAAAEWLPRFPLPGVSADALATSLLPAFTTPLGSLADNRSLAELPIADRLAELTFDLPLEPAGSFTLGDVAALMRRHLSGDDPLVGYPQLLADPALAGQPLKGFLTGSIDAVLRVGEPHRPRFVVVDYKTNRLGGDELTLGHYSLGPMVAAMCASHYPLQALLYCVALHRFLAGRLADYDPATHLGGVLYLFVRGMGGPDAGSATGVFVWRPPVALITELSRLLGQEIPMRDPELSVVADDLVGEFHVLGVLDWADLHPARHLCLLYGENDPTVTLAVALAVRALRAGSVCLELNRARLTVTGRDDELVEVPETLWPDDESWRSALQASPLVAVDPDGDLRLPVRLVGDRLYLTRYWEQEEQVRTGLVRRTLASPAFEPTALRAQLDDVFGPAGDSDQRGAVEHVARSGLTVLAGGPGTGKTTTIARMLALLFSQGVRRVALAAPTGKAAARMDEALRGAAAQLPPEVADWASGLNASTVHRLIGWTPRNRATPRFHCDNPLPHDAVIIDELSMVSLTQMAQLVDAVAPTARLVLVGDPDQLSSVSAGAVLADLTRAGWRGTGGVSPVVTLRRNYRFAGLLGDLAAAVRNGDPDGVLDLVGQGDPRLTLTPPDDQQDSLRARVVRAGRAIHAAALAGEADAALVELDRHRLLCAHRHGPFGATTWARQAEFWLRASVPGYGAEGEWFAGRAVLVTTNQSDWGLWNGDTGVVLVPGGHPVVHFAGTARRALSPDLLGSTQSVDALTVHKSQGSQFAEVTLVVPPVESPLLTRELLYTAVTRATDAVHLIGTPEALAEAVQRTARRASGLRERL